MAHIQQIGENEYITDNGHGTSLRLQRCTTGDGWYIYGINAATRAFHRGLSSCRWERTLDDVESACKAFRGISQLLATQEVKS